MKRSAVLPLALAVLLAPTRAHAGRTLFGWLYDTEVVPEHGVELESKLEERDVQFASLGDHETRWWLAPVVGITDRLELALPIEAQWSTEDSPPPGFVAGSSVPRRYGAELRYRFVAPAPVDAPAFVPLARVAVKRDVTGAIRPEADVVVSYQHGRVHALVDAGVIADVATRSAFTLANGDRHVEFHPGLGVSVRVVRELRLGAELYGEWSLDQNETGHTWAIVAPNMAWAHGRFWMSAAYGIGVYGIRSAPRIVWGIAL